MYCDKRLSSLFFSLFLSHESEYLISLFFFHSFFVSVRQKFIPRVLSLKSSTTAFLMRIFLFFLQAHKKGAKEEEKDTNARSHSHQSSLIVTFFHLFSRRHTTNTNKNTPHYYYTTTPFTRLFAISHRERERECVCVRERERERRSLSESERRVCSFYACGL